MTESKQYVLYESDKTIVKRKTIVITLAIVKPLFCSVTENFEDVTHIIIIIYITKFRYFKTVLLRVQCARCSCSNKNNNECHPFHSAQQCAWYYIERSSFEYISLYF